MATKVGTNDGFVVDATTPFRPTSGLPLFGPKTLASEIARTLLVIMRPSSLSADEEKSSYHNEAVSPWLHLVAQHAAALAQVLVGELAVSPGK